MTVFDRMGIKTPKLPTNRCHFRQQPRLDVILSSNINP